MEKNQKEEQKSELCKLKRWRGSLGKRKHSQFTLVSKEGKQSRRCGKAETGARTKESKVSYHGLQSLGITSRDMIASISLKPMSVSMAFISSFFYRLCGLFENITPTLLLGAPQRPSSLN